MTRPQRAVLALIGLYQGLRAGRPSGCRYYPSCSTYAAEAVVTHGAARGTWLAVRRLARCHPLGGRGVDLVPVRVDARGSRAPRDHEGRRSGHGGVR